MFDHPPIACHHDFSQCDLPTTTIGKNVMFARPHIRTAWGTFSILEAIIRAFDLLYNSRNSPDWYILLSGADYPIKSADRISSDLARSAHDVHMHHVRISHGGSETAWSRSCHERYCVARFGIPFVGRDLKIHRKRIVSRDPLAMALFTPYSTRLRCYAGETWFCCNRKAAKSLVDFHNERPELANYYRSLDPFVIVPEESYHHTIICNDATLNISNRHWRYLDWSGGGPHPKTLSREDLPRLTTSAAHFARKFDIEHDAGILDELDELIGR